MSRPTTCVTPAGRFIYGIHKPAYSVANLRQDTTISILGQGPDQAPVDNRRNFPEADVAVGGADWIFAIANPLPFKGCTYIDKVWADASVRRPGRITIARQPAVSLSNVLSEAGAPTDLILRLPPPLQIALAACSTDPADLIVLAEHSCAMVKSASGQPSGLIYQAAADGSLRPLIHNHPLFEAVANNPYLPDSYKIIMVIRPGAQGGSEIVGEWPGDGRTHVYEYLRGNSYIPGGHYAANMAEDAIRYSIGELQLADLVALRHLYYQRVYARLAEELAIALPARRRLLTVSELEQLRREILQQIERQEPRTTATLWGWNFGFDYAPTGYRFHASHQQIHQQYAMIADRVAAYSGDPDQAVGDLPTYSCGDLVASHIADYRAAYNSDFFTDYRAAIASNERMDGRTDLDCSLVVWADERVMLFVPKAQTSQWELQLMTLPDAEGALPGNILECDSAVRASLDQGLLLAQQALAGLGAKMVTSIEYPKRLGRGGCQGQPLLIVLLPRLPDSPPTFSEVQCRYINGHYPEDFAAVCRAWLEKAQS